jgi:hypothetical protein
VADTDDCRFHVNLYRFLTTALYRSVFYQ